MLNRPTIFVVGILCFVESAGSRRLHEPALDKRAESRQKLERINDGNDNGVQNRDIPFDRTLRKRVEQGKNPRAGKKKKKKQKKKKINKKNPNKNQVGEKLARRRERCSIARFNSGRHRECGPGETCYHPLGFSTGEGACVEVNKFAGEFEPCDASNGDEACAPGGGGGLTCLRANGFRLEEGSGTGVCGRAAAVNGRSAAPVTWSTLNDLTQPTNATAADGTLWYVDYSLGPTFEGQCVLDCRGGPPCGGPSELWDNLFKEEGECCQTKLWWMSQKQCNPVKTFAPSVSEAPISSPV